MRALTYEEFKAEVWSHLKNDGQTEHECMEAFEWFCIGRKSVRW